ncbi:hypothetical protein KAU55_07830 [Candidatus Bathyarchaeota archaeon]|nr:hypothetical protein [Candidatus Bathyarchaeota archaeon]
MPAAAFTGTIKLNEKPATNSNIIITETSFRIDSCFSQSIMILLEDIFYGEIFYYFCPEATSVYLSAASALLRVQAGSKKATRTSREQLMTSPPPAYA